MTAPSRLPDYFDNWAEWRVEYENAMRLYSNGEIGRMRARVLLQMLGFDLHSQTAELDMWMKETGK